MKKFMIGDRVKYTSKDSRYVSAWFTVIRVFTNDTLLAIWDGEEEDTDDTIIVTKIKKSGCKPLRMKKK